MKGWIPGTDDTFSSSSLPTCVTWRRRQASLTACIVHIGTTTPGKALHPFEPLQVERGRESRSLGGAKRFSTTHQSGPSAPSLTTDSRSRHFRVSVEFQRPFKPLIIWMLAKDHSQDRAAPAEWLPPGRRVMGMCVEAHTGGVVSVSTAPGWSLCAECSATKLCSCYPRAFSPLPPPRALASKTCARGHYNSALSILETPDDGCPRYLHRSSCPPRAA